MNRCYRYVLRIEEGTYKGQESVTSTDRIRDCKQTAIKDETVQENDEKPVGQNTGSFTVGDRVDVYLSDNKTGKARATIIEADGQPLQSSL